jgi:NADPH-dependent ferric siderophore reductase
VGSVVDSRSLSAYFTRITLDVPDVERLNLPNGADTAVGVYFDGERPAPGRTYTVRRDDRRDHVLS